MAKAQFITFEGIDGAGKSSHIERTAERLRSRGGEVLVTREPGGTELAEALRELVLRTAMDPLTEVLMVFAARRDHLKTVIEPALQRGACVLCDRFTDATFAYQGAGRGFDLGVLSVLEGWVQEGREPDLTLWFDLPPKDAAARRAASRPPDRFEALDDAFFTRVQAGYRARMDVAPGRFVRIDSSLSRELVAEQIGSVLTERGW